MAKPSENTGSDVTELKTLFRLAQGKPVNAAFGLDTDGKVVIKLDKMMKPKALAKALLEAKIKPVYSGKVTIDPNDTTTANFTVTKAVTGIQNKMIVALKGSGVNKVTISVGEDAEEESEASDQEEAPTEPASQAAPTPPDAPAAPAASAAAPDMPTAAASPSAPAPDVEPAAPEPSSSTGPDAGALTRQLAALVKQMMTVIAGNPGQKAMLAPLAVAAQAALKQGDLDAAQRGIDALGSALSDGAAANETVAPATPPSVPPSQASNAPSAATTPGAPDPATVRLLQKSHQAWTATRAKIDADMKKLVKSVLSASDDDDDFEKEFQSVVEPLVSTLDTTLSDLLAKAAAAKDDNEHQRLMTQARSTLAQYRKFVDSSPVIAHLDGNPFVPLAIGKTLDTTLSAISKIIQ